MFRKSRSPVGVRLSSRVDVDARNGWPTLYAVETKGYTTLLQKFVSTAGATESLVSRAAFDTAGTRHGQF